MLALLLVSVDMRVADLNQWAREALVEERRVQELGSAWKPAEPAAWNTQVGTKVGSTLQPVERALQLRTRPKIPICVPLFGKSPKISTSYLGKLNGSQQKLIGFGHGAPPRAQIR